MSSVKLTSIGPRPALSGGVFYGDGNAVQLSCTVWYPPRWPVNP